MNLARFKLLCLLVLVECLLVRMMVILLRQPVFPDKAGLILVWLFPIVFGIHLTEEFAFPGGYSDWHKGYRPQFNLSVTNSYLIKLNAGALVLAVLCCLGAFDYRGGYAAGLISWLIFVCVMASNALFHLRGTIQSRRYSPGVVTGLALHLPLAAVAIGYFVRSRVVHWASAIFCLTIGLLFQPVLDRFHARRVRMQSGSHP